MRSVKAVAAIILSLILAMLAACSGADAPDAPESIAGSDAETAPERETETETETQTETETKYSRVEPGEREDVSDGCPGSYGENSGLVGEGVVPGRASRRGQGEVPADVAPVETVGATKPVAVDAVSPLTNPVIETSKAGEPPSLMVSLT